MPSCVYHSILKAQHNASVSVSLMLTPKLRLPCGSPSLLGVLGLNAGM